MIGDFFVCCFYGANFRGTLSFWVSCGNLFWGERFLIFLTLPSPYFPLKLSGNPQFQITLPRLQLASPQFQIALPRLPIEHPRLPIEPSRKSFVTIQSRRNRERLAIRLPNGRAG
jgi:hypothetical protein